MKSSLWILIAVVLAGCSHPNTHFFLSGHPGIIQPTSAFKKSSADSKTEWVSQAKEARAAIVNQSLGIIIVDSDSILHKSAALRSYFVSKANFENEFIKYLSEQNHRINQNIHNNFKLKIIDVNFIHGRQDSYPNSADNVLPKESSDSGNIPNPKLTTTAHIIFSIENQDGKSIFEGIAIGHSASPIGSTTIDHPDYGAIMMAMQNLSKFINDKS